MSGKPRQHYGNLNIYFIEMIHSTATIKNTYKNLCSIVFFLFSHTDLKHIEQKSNLYFLDFSDSTIKMSKLGA